MAPDWGQGSCKSQLLNALVSTRRSSTYLTLKVSLGTDLDAGHSIPSICGGSDMMTPEGQETLGS